MADMPNLVKLLLSPSGRIGRRDYLIGLVGLVVIFTLYGLLINALGGSIFGFFAVLAFPFVILQIAYSVYGKRLHDIGRTLWPLTGLLALMLLSMIVFMLVFGGADYFAAHMENAQNIEASDEVAERINEEFKASQKPALPFLSWTIVCLLTAFTLWLALAKPQAGPNQYDNSS